MFKIIKLRRRTPQQAAGYSLKRRRNLQPEKE
jgi:hypothetical protein